MKENILYYHKKLDHLISKYVKRQLMNNSESHNHFGPMKNMTIGYLSRRNLEGLKTYPREIQNHFELNRSSTSEMLKRLEKEGYIRLVEDEKDARMKQIILTPKADVLHQENERVFLNFAKKISKGLTDEEIDTYIRVSEKMITNIKEEDDD